MGEAMSKPSDYYLKLVELGRLADDAKVKAKKDKYMEQVGRMVQIRSIIDQVLAWPMLCEQCGKPVEEVRKVYANPVCHSCLAPPDPLTKPLVVTTKPVDEDVFPEED
jgi:hypothetical protein